MKNVALTVCSLMLILFCAVPVVLAQGVKRGPDSATLRDPELEKDSTHNLEVARHYFKLKKAYRAALGRCEEIIAGNPNFAKIDKTLYIAGMSNLYLSQNRGKQKLDTIPEKSRQTPEKYREEARNYLSQLANNYPDSSFHKQALDALRDLGGALPKQ